MSQIHPSAGWSWVKQGFLLFRRQPTEMLTLFFAYMFLNMGISLLPVLGHFMPLLLIPVFAMSFMHASFLIEQGGKVHPGVLLAGFRSPALPRLLGLGCLYLLAISLATLISQLVDDGALYQLISNQKPLDPKDVPQGRLLLGMLVAALSFLPALMAFWFAGPLIMWHRMSVGKALFYSFFSVRRAGRAFLVYAAAWFVISGLLPAMLVEILIAMTGNTVFVILLMMPVLALLTTIRYCSFYPSFRDIFGKPDSV
ncbi:BPSS1780 family membrane protein [Undibacterium oligocarboniphilum]|uniref:Transmembrane protein n=1 Tax=Undibacterium oligocarboniphilum TaxID=666702 RepID=A0A850QE72_9BURK|nr:BPSS1780 family membrane protein [Undibacterium oligocarboniphilum]MBC3869883.1 hypothetical protein [Undibacterium oligocarboniphilum]NVO77499.1 hypothetical protein [Undibacterium oligocarboniphilum]